MLVVTGSRTEVIAQFVMASTEPGGRSGAFKAVHRPVSAFQAAVILFQSVVSVAAGAMAYLVAQLGLDRARVTVVAIGCDPLWRHAGTACAERKNAFAAFHIAMFAE